MGQHVGRARARRTSACPLIEVQRTQRALSLSAIQHRHAKGGLVAFGRYPTIEGARSVGHVGHKVSVQRRLAAILLANAVGWVAVAIFETGQGSSS